MALESSRREAYLLVSVSSADSLFTFLYVFFLVLNSYSPYCLPYTSFVVSSENFSLNQLIFPSLCFSLF